MKAFSASIFTEQTQASLKEDAYRLAVQDPFAVRSILECEDDSVLMEMEAKRQYYQSLLESQKQGLGIIDEFAGIGVVVAAIAAIVMLIKKAIEFIKNGGSTPNKSNNSNTSSTSSGSTTSKSASGNSTSGSDEKTPTINIVDRCDNPYIHGSPTAKAKIRGLSFDDFDKLASTSSFEVDLYNFPNLDVLSLNIPESDKIEECYSIINTISALAKAGDNKKITPEIEKLEKLCDEIVAGIDNYSTKPSSEKKSMTGKEYLTMNRPWIVKYDSKNKEFEFDSSYVNGGKKRLEKINSQIQKIYGTMLNSSKTGFNLSSDNLSYLISVLDKNMKAASSAFTKLSISLYTTFWKCVNFDIMQMNRVTTQISLLGNHSESTIYESAYYQNDPILQEYMFSRDVQDIDLELNEFCNMVDETRYRLSTYVHQNQMRAMNEEALIFSETSLSDYEKFEKLCAVQEALGAKIKKGYYNAIATIKEIFRKFMEKLTANFGTTKAYLDRYKNIILKSQFRNDQFKTQDLLTGINHILTAECPPMDFNQLMVPEADDVNKFFTKYIRPRLQGVDMAKDKDPADGSGMQGINDFFKSYFCMQNHDITISGPQFQKDITKYYDFLYDIRKIDQSIKKSLKTIDDTSAKVMKQAGVNVSNPQNPVNTTNAAPTATNGQPAASPQQVENSSAVYSNLYQKWFTISEDGVLVEAEKVATDNKTTPANQIKNVADKGNSDDSNQIKNNSRSTIDTKVRVYVDVCSSMLKAKMSACEFIRNECMQIIRNHVQSYIGGNQPQQQAQPQQNNAAQQQK